MFQKMSTAEITILFSMQILTLATPRVVVDLLTLTSWLHYVPEQLELFFTMLLLRSTDSTFSLQCYNLRLRV